MVHVVLPATHDMQLLVVPPQTTSLPPERSERLLYPLVAERSGMEQSLELGGGKISTLAILLSLVVLVLPPMPPINTCAAGKVFFINT